MKSGFILVNKDIDLSSNKVDQIIKRKLDVNKVGHLGTLDPLARGLLVVGINRGNKFFKYFDDLDKTYILTIRLGATTVSLDNENELIDVIDTDLRGKEEFLDNKLKSFIGDIKQVPPLYSAIRTNGSRAYRLANSQTISLKERDVKLYDIKRISDIEYKENNSFFKIYMHVSKGFYVRSFAYDFGKSINLPAMADKIERINVGKFKLEDAVSVDDVSISSNVISPLDYLKFESYIMDDEDYKDCINGWRIIVNSNSQYLKMIYNDRVIAIYKKCDDYYKMDLLVDESL